MTRWHLPRSPERIVCLTEETTELLYLLGEQERIVGISAYTERPARAKSEKPVVSAFIGGSVKKIAALKPDLIIGFSDIQAELAHDLIKANLPVAVFNQRSLQEILEVMVMVGTLVDRRAEVLELTRGYIARLEAARERSAAAKRRVRVYFEEWDEPRITAISWVSELIELAGGQNIFAEASTGKLAKERFVDDDAIINANPELILASWCGKPVDKESIRRRPGYEKVEAIAHKRIIELDPAIILQPGPACLSAGLDALEAAIRPLAEN
ncbi:cobalamin-binding protein [Lujinxingia sediminis]|uniref:Cobalamin-binding protein n=1 Tax=Lujinxingia sediminis TaxID=2480984 RepID=A0ABY0CUT8_9DELT|nr:ABC transporter substrate-binding protein [Lujinxingia sediminis]RVU46830.1 cobalamin-binding protein [Lujinxingia sediminis]